MALSNRDRIQRGIDALREELAPFVERSLARSLGKDWQKTLERSSPAGVSYRLDGSVNWDTQRLLRTMLDNWQSAFRQDLSQADRAFVGELIDVRNRFAHDQAFTADDTSRALDTMQRLLMSMGAKAAVQTVYQLREDLKRTELAEQARNQTRYATLPLEGVPLAGLKPWREVVTPHPDVASGNYVLAEFAANLGHVHAGRAGAEYAEPSEFFARTFLTAGLRRLLLDAIRRLTGKGGEPVVNLQTNFGGGKTHSLLALYHLIRAQDPAALAGVSDLLAEVGVSALPRCGLAVLVGTELEPAQPSRKPDGTVTRTLWGELAWQLGETKSGAFQSGAEAYALVSESDAHGTSPGRALAELLQFAAPCLILIDEWVAYVRQLYFRSNLPGGDFGANMTFAQALSEQVAGSPGALLVASLPQSAIETGGEGGQAALSELQNFFRRLHSSWTPATSEEGYEIVRRRLFEPVIERSAVAAREATVKAFADFYRKERADFPPVASEPTYLKLLRDCYPIHPALFRALYEVWSPLERFQQTRGVLRLMANVIHTLWAGQDRSLMILPAMVPMDGPLGNQLLEYLGDAWHAVMERDVDGAAATSYRIDNTNPALGRFSATRRMARATFIASAPTALVGQNPGVDEREIRLGAVQPGETGATFGDALRKLADQATYLYKDGPRHWFNTQANVNRMAADLAESYDADMVREKLVELVSETVRAAGKSDFAGVHPCPVNSADVPDEMDARLVVLGPATPQIGRNADTEAVRAAEEILRTRGTVQRNFRNTLVFLAPDAQRLQQMNHEVRRLMAWRSIWQDRDKHLQDAFQRSTAETRLNESERAVATQIGECWRWLLAPEQPDPMNAALTWHAISLSGSDSLTMRAAKRLATDERLILNYGAQRLRDAMDQFHLWGDGPHVVTETLWEYFARYLYLPRLRDSMVLAKAVEKGLDLAGSRFGYAAAVTEDGRYLDLTLTQGPVQISMKSVLLKAEDAARIEQEQSPPDSPPPGPGPKPPTPPRPNAPQPTRYFGSVELNADRSARDFGTIAQEVVAHLVAQRGAKVKLRVEIDATMPTGFPEDVIRLVSENGTSLKFNNNRFESDES